MVLFGRQKMRHQAETMGENPCFSVTLKLIFAMAFQRQGQRVMKVTDLL